MRWNNAADDDDDEDSECVARSVLKTTTIENPKNRLFDAPPLITEPTCTHTKSLLPTREY